MKSCLYLLTLFLIISALGCSRSYNPVLSLPQEDSFNLPIVNEATSNYSRTLLGIYTADLNTHEISCKIINTRFSSYHLNVRGYIPLPEIVINSYNPATHIMDIDVTLTNPSPVDVYDVRLIIFTDNINHMLLNADDCTDLYDIPCGLPINPFVAFAKDQPGRIFEGQSHHTANMLLYLPQGNTNVSFAIDASINTNCEEPYSIADFQQGTFYNVIGSSTEITVKVFDWQSNVNQVRLYCPQITNQTFLNLSQIDTDTWGCELVNNVGNNTGEYTGYIIANSSNSGNLALYDAVTITVGGEPGPYDPQIISSDPNSIHGRDIDVQNGYAYLACTSDGLGVYDVSDLQNPEYITHLHLPMNNVGWANHVIVESNYAYIALYDFSFPFQVIDISNPLEPVFAKGFISQHGDARAYDMKISDNLVYLGSGFSGMTILDISSPLDVYEAGWNHTADSDNLAYGNNYAFCADANGFTRIFDVSDPSNPTDTGKYFASASNNLLEYENDYLYAGNSSGFKVIDVSDISNVSEIGFCELSKLVNGMEITDKFAYLANFNDGLVCIDIRNPEVPTIVSTTPFEGKATAIKVIDNYAYLSTTVESMVIVKLW